MANRVSVFCCSKKYNPFIMKVNSGASGAFTIPTDGGYTYNYSVKVQGENIWFFSQTGDCTINFPETNTDYIIEIRGVFPKFESADLTQAQRDQMEEIITFGEVELHPNQFRAYYKCTNLTFPKIEYDVFKNVTNAEGLFYNTLFNSEIEDNAFESVVNLKSMFQRTPINVNVNNIYNFNNVIFQPGNPSFPLALCSNFNNGGDRLIWDFNSISQNLGTRVFPNSTAIEEIEFRNAENVTWSTGFTYQDMGNTKVFIMTGLDRSIDLSANVGGNGLFPYLTGAGVKEFIDNVDKTVFETVKLTPTVYANFETYVQGLGYTDIADYLLQTNNNWTVIS